MKKTIFAIATVMALISCGGSNEEVVTETPVVADTAVVVDTVAVSEEAADETAGGVQDGTKVK